MIKRFFDLLLSFVGILALAPVLLIVAIAVKCSSRGPVLYTQKRSGLHGSIFSVYKFRTMVDRAETLGTSVTTQADPRVTSLGRFLRRTKLDELPQLFNVLKGDMSFVGPRPDVPEIVAKYTPEIKKILSVRPGITSLATLHFRDEEVLLSKAENPDRFYEKILVPFKVELAMEHVRRHSFWFDFKVLVQTVWVLTPFAKILPVRELEMVRAFRKKYSL